MSFLRGSPGLRIVVGILASISLILYLRQMGGPAPPPPPPIVPNLKEPTEQEADDAEPDGLGAIMEKQVQEDVESRNIEDPIGGLELLIEQNTTTPPTITVTVHNKHPAPITVLEFNSPLDKMALQLGLLEIHPQGAPEPIHISPVQVRRKWPPTTDALITIPAGGSVSQNVVLKESTVPREQLGQKAVITMHGRWDSVWARPKAAINLHLLDTDQPKPGMVSGDFVSNRLEFKME